MSREIKFRAWDEHNNEWLDGHLFNINLFFGELQRNNSAGIVGGVTIEQYTGLKDKNGKEIYEGDVANIEGGADKPAFCSVIFKDGCFCLDWEYNDSNPELKYYIDMSFCKFEVIGNVHEDKELIK